MHVVQEPLWKQDELKSERKSLVARIAQIDKQIAALDDAIRIWEPDHSPTTPTNAPRKREPFPGGLFANDNLSAMVLASLRDAQEPISTHDCAPRIAARKDIPEGDPHIAVIANRVSTCLSNLAAKRRVERAGSRAR